MSVVLCECDEGNQGRIIYMKNLHNLFQETFTIAFEMQCIKIKNYINFRRCCATMTPNPIRLYRTRRRSIWRKLSAATGAVSPQPSRGKRSSCLFLFGLLYALRYVNSLDIIVWVKLQAFYE